jgi:hypothetical protein
VEPAVQLALLRQVTHAKVATLGLLAKTHATVMLIASGNRVTMVLLAQRATSVQTHQTMFVAVVM